MATTDLKELHVLLRQLEELREKIARGPRLVAVQRRKVDDRIAAIAAAREDLVKLRKAGDAKNLQMQTKEAKLVELKVKLNQASTNIEFDTLKGQIDADTMANSVLEDEILETFEKIDAAEQRIAELEKQLEGDKADAEATAERVAAAEEGLQREAAGLEGAITEQEKGLATSLVEQYRRLIAAHGAGALAAVEEKICSACYVELEPQLRVELKTGKSVFCRSCGRLLYRDEESDAG